MLLGVDTLGALESEGDPAADLVRSRLSISADGVGGTVFSPEVERDPFKKEPISVGFNGGDLVKAMDEGGWEGAVSFGETVAEGTAEPVRGE